MPARDNPPPKLTDLETKALRAMRRAHDKEFPEEIRDDLYLTVLAKVAVEAITPMSASGRRRGVRPFRQYSDPGCTPDSIRKLARCIEASFTSMPNGWTSADDPKEEPNG